MVKNKERLLKHVPEDKKDVLNKILDKINIVSRKSICVETDFLDPYEIKLSEIILNSFDDIEYRINGGYENSERNIIYIYPKFLQYKENKIDILTFKTTLNISHRDVLGAIISLGVDRRKIGDIVINDEYTHIFISSEISKFIEFNLEKIGNRRIKFINKNFTYTQNEYNKMTIIISSLRLDTFLSGILKISRTKSSNIVKSGNVKVNFKVENSPDFTISESSLISIKHYGRFIFSKIIGNTKKQNFIVELKIPK